MPAPDTAVLTPETATIEVLFDEATIAKRIQSMAQTIVQDMGHDLVLISVLRGSFMFAADMMRGLSRAGAQSQIGFISLSSYGDGMVSQGIRVVQDLDLDVTGTKVLVVEDIIESGRTVKFTQDLLWERGAADVRTVSLLHKPGFEKVDVTADYIGFVCPPKFVVGFGLDWANRFRDLPFIGAVEQTGV